MSMRQVLVLSAVSMALMGTGVARADSPSSAGDRAEIELLKARLEKLESKMDGQEAMAAGAEEGSAVLQLPSGLHGVNFSGFVDTSYTYNFNEPTGRTSTLRVFDTRSGDFMLNNVELAVDKAATSESPVGFRTDLHLGTDAEVTGGVTTGLGSTTDELDIQQGYVQYLAPLGNGLDLKFGKMTTLHGAEVTESKDNWNFSRSWLFGYAEPLTHTGVRAGYAWNDMVSTTVGVNNGWDVVDDNNKAKTIEAAVSVAPMDGVTFGGAYTLGAEQGSDSRDQRHFWSFVAGYDPMDSLHLKLAFDYGTEEDALSETGNGNASWNGFAAYAKYDVNEKWSVAGRFEIFNDQDGVRTGVNTDAGGGGLTGSAIHDLRLVGYTLTNEYKIHEHLIGRLEYRLDTANSNVFAHDQSGGFENHQNTIAVEFIAPF